MKAMPTLALIVALLGSGTAAACRFDADCSHGGKCVKEWGASSGICSGGAESGNDGDRHPGGSRDDPGHVIGGKSCRADVDCKPGYACLMSGGSYVGVCVAI